MLILSTILKLDVPSRVCVLSTIRVLNMRLGICKMLAWQNLDLPSLCKAASDKNGGLASIGLTFMISHWLVCCWVESCFVVGVVGGIVVCLLSEEQGIFVHVLTSLEFDGHSSSINELEIICDGSALPPKSQSHTQAGRNLRLPVCWPSLMLPSSATKGHHPMIGDHHSFIPINPSTAIGYLFLTKTSKGFSSRPRIS